ncbi:MAG: PAS domain-containing protein, partial [Myxococcota bacterium]
MGDRGTPEDGDAERLRALETVVDVAGLGTWRWDAGADEVHLDAVLRRILGFPGEACALGAAELFESVHPDDRPGFRAALLSVRTGKRRVVVRELRFRTSTSAWKWVELRATQRDGAGNVLGVVRDIAKRRATQDEAQRLGRELRQVVESIPGCVYRCTYEAPWSTLYASESFEELTGFTAEQFVNQEVSFEELVHPQDIAFLRLEVEQSIRERRPYELRYRIENRDGHGRWVLDRGSAVHDPRTGRVVELAGVLVDISEQQAQEEQVRVLGSALATATDAVLITAAEPLADGPPILWANEAFTEQTGYALHELIGESPRLFQGPDSPREPLARIRAALEAWQPVQVELLNYRKDGTPYWSELSIVPLADETGWYTHWVSVQRDITARIEAAE